MHMKFLKDETISKELCEAIKKYKEIFIVVAWATTGHEVFRTLLSHTNKIKKLIIGTDSYITDPRFIECFRHKNLSLMSNTKQRPVKQSSQVVILKRHGLRYWLPQYFLLFCLLNKLLFE